MNCQGSGAHLIHESLFRVVWCLRRLPLRRHVCLVVVPLQHTATIKATTVAVVYDVTTRPRNKTMSRVGL